MCALLNKVKMISTKVDLVDFSQPVYQCLILLASIQKCKTFEMLSALFANTVKILCNPKHFKTGLYLIIGKASGVSFIFIISLLSFSFVC